MRSFSQLKTRGNKLDVKGMKLLGVVVSGFDKVSLDFLVWLAIQDRLSTGVRMRKWGIQQACVLCGEKDETRDHLFFACPYSYTVWDRVAGRRIGENKPGLAGHVTVHPSWSFHKAGSNPSPLGVSDSGVSCMV